ncbi:MAG: TIGR04283 family arsenosugar biosynthesis glycosyltransferase [Nitrospirae bacterium]|nr:TIGR04283 family arsenosugar biosynthesis glycosyltransferase [Nitrospirota bacterium]
MISVIIPALNEERTIEKCIVEIRHESCDLEIIVADGGSSDKTGEIASGCSEVAVVTSRKGRGLQLNAGAAAATGDILLFLHADTTLEKGWSQSILKSLDENSVVGGAFTFAVNNPSWKYRLLEAWVKLRCTLCELPYGDQAIFIRKDLFHKLNGYQNIPLMEDVELIEKMKRTGKITILDKKAFTSERRWSNKGLIRTAAINQLTMMLYKLGVSPEALFRLYYR